MLMILSENGQNSRGLHWCQPVVTWLAHSRVTMQTAMRSTPELEAIVAGVHGALRMRTFMGTRSACRAMRRRVQRQLRRGKECRMLSVVLMALGSVPVVEHTGSRQSR